MQKSAKIGLLDSGFNFFFNKKGEIRLNLFISELRKRPRRDKKVRYRSIHYSLRKILLESA